MNIKGEDSSSAGALNAFNEEFSTADVIMSVEIVEAEYDGDREIGSIGPNKYKLVFSANLLVSKLRNSIQQGEPEDDSKGVYRIVTLLASGRLAPTSFTRKPALQTVGGGRSSIRSTTGNNLPPSICTRRCDGFLPRTESPLKADQNKSDHPMDGGDAAALRRRSGGREVEERRGGRFYALEARLAVGPQPLWLRNHNFGLAQRIMVKRIATSPHDPLGIQLAVGPQPLWLRNHNFGLAQRIMVKRIATSPHDPLGITESACKNQLIMVSVQYGPFNTYVSIRSTTIGKSRVARDPISMHTSWRSNSDIASVTSIGYPRMRASGESSTTKHRLLHASGPHPIPPPNDPNTTKTSDLSCDAQTQRGHENWGNKTQDKFEDQQILKFARYC
ncbi:hypothetical protein F511_37566 [Dorcoceras hygrometricum]|uniref:Uncharacterized protein n=1 Tax=Dorcoceras hygrometricum TaxID=472368 RepID=A0A2Z7ANZ3_9LAMI|nr:hypothetical protein F511_37566 [Dorcoceras hygrometricum]